MSIFANKTLLITGGTGSFGNAVLNRFLRTDIGEIRIFSRDEKKQDDMAWPTDIAHGIIYLLNGALDWKTGLELVIDGVIDGGRMLK